MTPPGKLYRYRSCDDQVLERELEALEHSYLYAPSFSAMNDPMEAFMAVGDPGDGRYLELSPHVAESLKHLYAQMSTMVSNAGLISFSETAHDLPLWAYYASNFAGFCLEFDTKTLHCGDLRGEQLHPVTYAEKALPSVSIAELFRSDSDPGKLFTSRLTRKRVEWAHEKEWRYLVGKVGPKHLLDTALRRVFLGPRMPQAHANRVMAVVAGRPIEVLQGKIEGFELRFATVQAATDEASCARAVPGRFVPADDLRSAEALQSLLEVPFESLVSECERLAQHPNMTHFDAIEVSGTKPGTLFITTWYRLRNGREIHRQRYYDSHMRMVHED